jgi:amidase
LFPARKSFTPSSIESAASTLLCKAGEVVREAKPPELDQTLDLTLDLWTADCGAAFRKTLARSGTSDLHPFMQQVLSLCASRGRATGEEFGSVLQRWWAFRSSMLRFMHDFDAILCPPCAFTALRHGQTFAAEFFPGFSYAMTFNLTGWPAAVVPFGLATDGLPTGIQVAGVPWRDELVLAVARRIESCVGSMAV